MPFGGSCSISSAGPLSRLLRMRTYEDVVCWRGSPHLTNKAPRGVFLEPAPA